MEYYAVFNKEIIDNVNKITGTKYDVVISAKKFEAMLEDLIDKYEGVVTKFEEYAKKVDEEYTQKNIDPYEFYGVSPQDF